jgi:hypothetical protein
MPFSSCSQKINKRQRDNTVAKQEQKVQEIQVKMSDGKVETHYVNFLHVQHTPYEFIATFGLLVPPADLEDKEIIQVDPVVRLVFSHQNFPNVVQALQNNLKSFERKQQEIHHTLDTPHEGNEQ